jgi:hypothetical protein
MEKKGKEKEEEAARKKERIERQVADMSVLADGRVCKAFYELSFQIVPSSKLSQGGL